jgi:hypothetical protein
MSRMDGLHEVYVPTFRVPPALSTRGRHGVVALTARALDRPHPRRPFGSSPDW